MKKSKTAGRTGTKVTKTSTRRVADSSSSVDEEDSNVENDENVGDTDETMDAASDTDGDSEGTAEETEKKKRGKRQIIFDCCQTVTLIEDDPAQDLSKGEIGMVLDPIPVTMPSDDSTVFDVAAGRKEAISLFEKKYGKKPACINGPYYIRKGITAQPRKRETVNVSVAADAPFISKRGMAIHKFKDHEWHVLVNFTEKDDLVYCFYQKLVNPADAPKGEKEKAKFTKPTAKFLPITSLKEGSLKELPSTSAS